MRYEQVYIEALAYELPRAVVTTSSIEELLAPTYRRLGIGVGFLEAITGIRARRFWDDGVQPSEVATLAAENAFAQTYLGRERVECLVSTSVCKDYLEPSVASLVHGNLGLGSRCLNFDVGNACLGFMTGMIQVANMIELGQIKVGLVVVGEGSREVTQSTVHALLPPTIDFQQLRDNLATLTLGSGATAMLMVHKDLATNGHRLLGCASQAATEHSRLCIGTETYMKTDPAKLLVEGVKVATRTWAELRAELRIAPARIREYVMHQVGKGNHDAILNALDLPSDRALRMYPEHGNMGAAGVPVTLGKAVEEKRIESGDKIALMGIGSGLNCTMMAVEW